jgi:hypothetical protein
MGLKHPDVMAAVELARKRAALCSKLKGAVENNDAGWVLTFASQLTGVFGDPQIRRRARARFEVQLAVAHGRNSEILERCYEIFEIPDGYTVVLPDGHDIG